LKQFSPTGLEILLDISQPDTLVVLQNYFPGWKAFVDEQKIYIKKYNDNFISIPVSENSKTVKLIFTVF
jgi:uncharacterized membrane protein YfhO